MASIKVLKQLREREERGSLVKELVSLRPVTPTVIKECHPLETLYKDPIPPITPIDQFAPYLSRKMESRRKERIEKIKTKERPATPTYAPRPTNTPTPRRRDADSRREVQNTEYESPRRPQIRQTLRVHLDNEAAFDKIASNATTAPLHKLVETTLQMHFLAEKVIFFHDISSVNTLYSPSTTASLAHGTGIVGFAQFSRKIVNVQRASKHAAYLVDVEGNICPPDSRVLCFPIFDNNSIVRAVVEVLRAPTSPAFDLIDESFVEYFQKKMKLYSRWLFQPAIDSGMVASMARITRLKKFVESTCDKLTKMFGCKEAELWNYNTETSQFQRYQADSKAPVNVAAVDAGIAGYAMKNETPVACITSKVHSSYNPNVDGTGESSVLAIPVKDPDSTYIYCIVLRGKRMPPFFTDYDERILARIAPYIFSTLSSSQVIEANHQALKNSIMRQERLRSLLEVAETLSGQLRMDELINKIMSQACDLVKADRCSLFMVNESRDKLVTSFQGGLTNAIEIPIHAGIVGYTATTGNILNIPDAYADPRFNRATDLATGYRTLTLLCVPIYDEKGEIRGVTEMINKLDGVFTEEDEKMIRIFNVFTGISIENARLYKASIDLSLQLRTFFDISYSLSQPQTMKSLMEEIIRNTRKVVGAVTAHFFMIDETSLTFEPYVTDEDFSAKPEKPASKTEDILCVKRAIIKRLIDGKTQNQDTEAAKEEEARKMFIQKVLTTKESLIENDANKPEKSFMMCPIISSDKAVMGCLMMQTKKNNQKFTYDDLKLLESYSVFLSISLERSRLKSIAQLGAMEVEIQAWISETERGSTQTPMKLTLSEAERNVILHQNFASGRFNAFKALFYLYQSFNLCRTFNITNEVLYHFLFELKQSYNEVPYHNWSHAVDVAQFMAFQLKEGNLDTVFNRMELLCLFTACICHDAGHDGFSLNTKAMMPLRILFKNQSVMETHHCGVSIGILTRDECNIFGALNDAELMNVWSLFITLILCTDMENHFTIMEKAGVYTSNWRDSAEGKLAMMQLLIKCADLCNVARQFELADRCVDTMCEEFFRSGDLSMAIGMYYTSPTRDRNHLDKQKSRLGFYRSVCLPLFKLAAECAPGLNTCVDQVKSNIATWEQRSRQKINV